MSGEDWAAESTAQPAVLESAEVKLFGRWDPEEVQVNDISLTVSDAESRLP